MCFAFFDVSREVLKKRDENSPADISSSHNRDVHGAPWGSASIYKYAVVMATRNPSSSTCKSGVSLENLGCNLQISVETADFLHFLDLRDLGARGLYNKSRAPKSSRSRSKRYPDLGQNGRSAEQKQRYCVGGPHNLNAEGHEVRQGSQIT